MFKNIKTVIKFLLFKPIDFLVRLSKISHIPKTILLVRVDRIGDYILFRNFIEVLKKSKKYRDCKITLCGNIIWKDLAEKFDDEYIDEFIWIDVKKINRNIFYRYKTLLNLAKRSFKTIIHPTYSRDFFCGDSIVKICSANEKIGSVGDLSNIEEWQKNISDRYYTRLTSASEKNLFEFYRNQEFFEKLLQHKISINRPFLNEDQPESNEIVAGSYAVIAPGAGADFRRWDEGNFAEMSDYLYKKYKLDVVLVGNKEEKKLARNVGEKVKTNRIKNLAGSLKLSDLVEIIKEAKIVVSNETSVVHIAAAVDSLCVSISNGNHFGRFNPYPRKISANIKTVYPQEIMDNLDNFEYLSQRYKYGSDLNINSIKINDVKRKINEVLKGEIDLPRLYE